MEPIIVGIADCAVTEIPGQVLATYALGSCIGLALHDHKSSVGGLLHFMLPDSSIDAGRGRNRPYMFADTAIPLLLERMWARGASRRGLIAYAAGGAQILDAQNVFEIGKRNYLATRRLLWKAGILLRAEAIGGSMPRTMHFEVGTGRLCLEEGGMRVELAAGIPKGERYGIPGLNCR